MPVSWNLDHRDADSVPDESLQDRVKKKLVSLELNCENVISSDPIDQVFERYDIFALPVVLVYGSDGALAKKFEGAFTYEEDVFPFVAGQLER